MRKTREASSKKAPWKKPNPRKASKRAPRKLSAEQKASARARAKRAGRHYPNLVDNMWASQRAPASHKSRSV
jgi:hypothetical protein